MTDAKGTLQSWEWTPDQDRLIRELYPTRSSVKVGEVVGRSAKSVQLRAMRLGVVKKNTAWLHSLEAKNKRREAARLKREAMTAEERAYAAYRWPSVTAPTEAQRDFEYAGQTYDDMDELTLHREWPHKWAISGGSLATAARVGSLSR